MIYFNEKLIGVWVSSGLSKKNMLQGGIIIFTIYKRKYDGGGLFS
jgi:hypothetical protein